MTEKRTFEGWTMGGWTISRIGNTWLAEQVGRKLEAETLADLLIKMDQARAGL